MEVGEGQAYDAFKAAVKARGKMAVGGDAVTLTGSGGHTLRMTYRTDGDLPVLLRDGKERDWMAEKDLYRPVDADGPMRLGRKEGTLTVRAGGHTFIQTVTAEGEVTFREE